MKRGFKTIFKRGRWYGSSRNHTYYRSTGEPCGEFLRKRLTSVVNTILKKDIIAGKGNLNRSADRMNEKSKSTDYSLCGTFRFFLS